jgi:Flp pilus assembly protein TadG
MRVGRLVQRRDPREDGQAIVEFALVFPVLLLLIVGLIEFSFVLNSRNTVGFASRDAAMLAAEGGSKAGTDCVVLSAIDRDIVSPARAIRVTGVEVFWSDANGAQIGSNANVYSRTGSTTCTYGDGTSITVPYTLSTAGYIEDVRCDVIGGCGGGHTELDIVGVRVTYQHSWLTSFARMTGSGITFTQTTAMRIEPQL